MTEPAIDRDLERHIRKLGDEPSVECDNCGSNVGDHEGELQVNTDRFYCYDCLNDPSAFEPDQWAELHDELGPAAHDAVRDAS